MIDVLENHFLRKDKTWPHKLHKWQDRPGGCASKYWFLCDIFFSSVGVICLICGVPQLDAGLQTAHRPPVRERCGRRGSTLYLSMRFWSFQIRAVRVVCRHEAQAEYTNPAAAWHGTHTHTEPFTKAQSDSEFQCERSGGAGKNKWNERIWK